MFVDGIDASPLLAATMCGKWGTPASAAAAITEVSTKLLRELEWVIRGAYRWAFAASVTGVTGVLIGEMEGHCSGVPHPNVAHLRR